MNLLCSFSDLYLWSFLSIFRIKFRDWTQLPFKVSTHITADKIKQAIYLSKQVRKWRVKHINI